MYFTTFNHYDELDEIDEIEEIKNDLCIICLDPSITNNNLIKMQSILSYLLFSKDCSCNGIFHYNCLLKWINTTNSCPICRKPIQRDINVTNQNILTLNNTSQIFRFINFTNNNAYKIFKYFFLFLFFKTIYDILNDIEKTVQYNSDLEQNVCPYN
jgi:hypothetical protein